MRAQRVFYALVAGAVLSVVSLAYAADDGHGTGDPMNLDVWQAGYTIVVFLILVLILGKFAWKPILEGLQRRERFIRDSLESAKRDREAAETKLREYEEKTRQARDEASAIVEEGRRDAEAVRRRLEEEARHSAESIIERAKRDIGIARDSALRDLHEESARMAITMASEVLKRQLTAEDHERLVADALEQLKQRGISQN